MNCSAYLHPTVLMLDSLLSCWRALHRQWMSLSVKNQFECESGPVSANRDTPVPVHFRRVPTCLCAMGPRPATTATMPQRTHQFPMMTSEGLKLQINRIPKQSQFGKSFSFGNKVSASQHRTMSFPVQQLKVKACTNPAVCMCS